MVASSHEPTSSLDVALRFNKFNDPLFWLKTFSCFPGNEKKKQKNSANATQQLLMTARDKPVHGRKTIKQMRHDEAFGSGSSPKACKQAV